MRKSPALLVTLVVAALAAVVWWISSGRSDSPTGPGTTQERSDEGAQGEVDADGRAKVAGESEGNAKGAARNASEDREEDWTTRVRGRLVGVQIDWSKAKLSLQKGRPDFEDAIFDAMRSGFRNLEESARKGGLRQIAEPPVILSDTRPAADGSFEILTGYDGAVELDLEHPLARLTERVRFEIAPAGDAKQDKEIGDVACDMAASLLVFVEDADGRAVEGSTVRIFKTFDPMSFVNLKTGAPDFSKVDELIRPRTQSTDKRGMARFMGMEAGGDINVHAKADGHGPRRTKTFLVEGRERVIRVRLPAAAKLAVRLFDAEEAPVPHVRVSVNPITDDVHGLKVNDPNRRSIRGRTDTKGHVLLDGLPSGAARVRIEALGYVNQDHEVRLEAGSTVEREFVLDRGKSVEGIVYDDLQRPVVGAKVGNFPALGQKILGFKVSSFVPDGMLSAASNGLGVDTDKDGKFVIWGLDEKEPVQLIAAKKGFSSAMEGAKPGERNIELVLRRLGSVVGRVLREEDGKPLEDFTVRAVERNFMVLETKFGRQENGADGAFTLSDLPQGSLTIEVAAVGRAPRRLDVKLTIDEQVEPTELGDIRLSPPSAIDGVVVDPDDKPVEGAIVRPARGGIADMEFLAKLRNEQSATTDADGKFKLVGLPARRMRLSIDKEGFATKRSKTMAVEKGKTLGPIKIVLGRGSIVDGRIVDPDGKPLEGWLVSLKSQSLGVQRTQTSDAEGKVRYEAMAAGPYRIEALPRGFMKKITRMSMRSSSSASMPDIGKIIGESMSQVVTGKVDVPEEDRTEFEVTSKRVAADDSTSVTVEGRVTIGGAPLDTGFVEFHALGDVTQFFATVEKGQYSMSGLLPGSYRVRVRTSLLRSSSREGTTVKVPSSGTQRVDLELPGGRLTGRVVSPSGKAVAHALVRLTSERERRMFDTTDLVEIGNGVSLSDEDGEFSFEGLSAGKYTIVARELGFSGGPRSARVENILLSAGQVLEGVDLTMAQGAEIRVLVRSTDGAPLKGVTLRALDSGGAPLASYQTRRTDDQGEGTLRGLAPGAYRVLADASMYAAAVSEIVVLSAERDGSIVVKMKPGVTVSGRLFGAAPVDVPAHAVAYSLWDSKDRLVRAGVVRVPAVKAQQKVDRTVTFGRLEPGRYRARLESMHFGAIERRREVPTTSKVLWSFDLDEQK